MFSLFKKHMLQNSLAAVCPEIGGISSARVRRERDLPPTLEFCDFQSLESGDSELRLLEKIAGENGLDRSMCVGLVELGTYSLLMVEAPDVQPGELRAAIRWRIKDLIDFHIDDAVIDVFEIPDTKAAGRNKMMYAVVARSSVVKQRVDQLLDAGLNLTAIDIPELALRNIAALLPEDVGGVGLIYVGKDRGLITITRQSTLYLSRRMERGISSLPDTAMHANDRDVIETWLDGIIVELQRSLDYYESHFSQPQVSGVVIAPLPRNLSGIAEYITAQVDIPARVLDVNSLIDVQAPLETELQSRCLLAIGAALRQETRIL